MPDRDFTDPAFFRLRDEPGESVFMILKAYAAHEDNLIADRTGWFIQFNSLLFGALAISASVIASSDPEKIFSPIAVTIVFSVAVFFVSLVGLWSCFATRRSVRAAHRAIDNIRYFWRTYYETHLGSSGFPPISIVSGKLIDGQNYPSKNGSNEILAKESDHTHKGSYLSLSMPIAVGSGWVLISVFSGFLFSSVQYGCTSILNETCNEIRTSLEMQW